MQKADDECGCWHCSTIILNSTKPCALCGGGPYCSECWQAHLHECKSLEGEPRAEYAERLIQKRDTRRTRKKRQKIRLIEHLRDKTKGRCYYCNEKIFRITIDHFIPKVLGGTNRRDNLVPACYECNHAKGETPGDEFKRAQSEAIAIGTKIRPGD